MATTKREKLFTEFPPVSTEQWEEVIKADLKGADYERKLVWKTPEGFNVRPYYRAENLAGLKFLGSEAGVFPYVRGTRAHNRWKIHQTVIVNCPKEANAVALKILNAGVDSIEFQIVPETFSAEDLNTLLKDIHIPAVEITFSGSKTAHVAELVIAKIEKEQLPAEEVHINFCIDPLVKKLTSKGSFCSENGAKCFEKIADLVRKTKTYKGIRVITVSGEIFSNAGSTIVEALAFSLAAGHDYLVRLMDMGFTIEEAAKKIRFSQAITSNYFMEIAKLRAGRMLWANIVKAYNPAKNCPCKMFTHAVTSTWNQTAYDPYVNMLRGTTEAMSASIAGVHSLEVTPFNKAYEDPNEFSMRIARNVELLLKHESHFDQVVDPAGGSYYIENLTDSIANEAWKLFREIEEKGGYTAAYESGFIVVVEVVVVRQIEVRFIYLVPQVGVLFADAVILLLQSVDLIQYLGIGFFQCLLVERHIVAVGQLLIQRLHLGVQLVQLLDVCQKRFLLRFGQGIGAADKRRLVKVCEVIVVRQGVADFVQLFP